MAGEKEKPQINCPTKGTGSVPGQGTKIWQAVQPKKKKKKHEKMKILDRKKFSKLW